jgi:hypothetical protein
VFPKQVKGLTEGMEIPVSQMVFGTVSVFQYSEIEQVFIEFVQDYPYGIGFWDVDANIAGLTDASFLSEDEKEDVYYRNAKTLWGRKIS